jgi:RNase P/RNase MRP subunit POP5
VSLIGGAYMYRIPSKVRIHFKRYLNIEYMSTDDVEREEFLKLLVKKMLELIIMI